MCPEKTSDSPERGWIIPIGGGEKRVHSSVILSRFIGLSGGQDARLVVIPTASQLDDTGGKYHDLFREMGAGDVRIAKFDTREDCEDPQHLDNLKNATGIFFTGGDQLRLATIIGGTSAAQVIRRANASGTHVAGTSAGAAFICEHMIAHGRTGPTPKAGMATLAPGLGLTNRVIIDQHFRERGRLGRLLTALSYNPFSIGIGVDEDTGAFIAPDNVVHVYGSGGLTVIDPSDIQHSSMADAKRGEPICLIGVKLHILLDGGTFDLKSRVAAIKAE